MCPTILTLSKWKKKKKYTKSPKKLQILSPRGYDTHSNIIHQIYLIFFFTAEAVLLTAHAWACGLKYSAIDVRRAKWQWPS